MMQLMRAIVLATLFLCASSWDPTPEQLWRWQKGSIYNDYAFDAAVNEAGDLIICGQTYLTVSGSEGIAYKLSGDDGTTLWQHQLGANDNGADTFTGVAVDLNGDVFLGGSAGNLFTVTKLDGETGFPLWRWVDTQPVTGSRFSYSTKVATDTNGDVVLGGHTNGTLAGLSNVGDFDFAVTKLSGSTGAMIWQWQGGSESYDSVRGIAVDAAGNVVIGGSTDGCVAAVCPRGWDQTAVNLSANGVEQWRWQGFTNLNEFGSDVALLPNGGIVLVGSVLTVDTFYGDHHVVEATTLSLDGEHGRTFYPGYTLYDDFGKGIAIDDWTGDVVFVGYSSGDFEGDASGGHNFIATRWDPTLGTTLWEWQDGTTSDDFARAAAFDSAGNLFIVGYSEGDWSGSNMGYIDMTIVKLGPLPGRSVVPTPQPAFTSSPSSTLTSVPLAPSTLASTSPTLSPVPRASSAPQSSATSAPTMPTTSTPTVASSGDNGASSSSSSTGMPLALPTPPSRSLTSSPVPPASSAPHLSATVAPTMLTTSTPTAAVSREENGASPGRYHYVRNPTGALGVGAAWLIVGMFATATHQFFYP